MHNLIIVVGQYFIVLAPLIALFTLWRLNDRGERMHFLALILLGGILSLVFAHFGSKLYYDPRPFVMNHTTPLISHATDNGFPSDHALLTSFVGWACITFSLDAGLFGLFIAIAVSSARVFAGVHHWVDIAGSFAMSGVATLIVHSAISKYTHSSKRIRHAGVKS